MLKGAKVLDALLSEKYYTATHMGLSFSFSHVSPVAQNIPKPSTAIQSFKGTVYEINPMGCGSLLVRKQSCLWNFQQAFSGESVLGKLK